MNTSHSSDELKREDVVAEHTEQNREKPVRYKLVEAEEDIPSRVEAKENFDNLNSSNNERERKGVTWRRFDLEEDFSEPPFAPPGFRGRGRGGRRGRGFRGGRGRSARPRGPRLFISKYASYQPSSSALFTPDTVETRLYYANLAAGQVEFYFSVENLARDSFLRSYMDCEGYVPIAFVCNFPGVACYGADLNEIVEWLRQSELLEIDESNETIRLRDGWEVWLYPNPTDGGRGVPKWTKVAPDQDETGQELNTETNCSEQQNQTPKENTNLTNDHIIQNEDVQHMNFVDSENDFPPLTMTSLQKTTPKDSS